MEVTSMKTSKLPTSPQKLAAAVQTARRRFAKAEGAMETAAKQASITKRKRKEAKEAARLAKKELKRARLGMAEARRELDHAEKRLSRAGSKAPKHADNGAAPKKASPQPSAKKKKPA